MDSYPLHLKLFALLFLLALSAFFSSAETSLMSLNRYRLRHLAKDGHRGARLAQALLLKTDHLLGAILLGNTFAAVAIATISDDLAISVLGNGQIGLIAGTVAVTFVILVFGEITPKVIAAAYAEKLAFAYSYILYPLTKVLYPAIWFVNLFVAGILKILRIHVNFSEASHAISTEELRSIVVEAGGYIPKKNRTILLNLFDLEKATVDDVMTPHTQIESLDVDAPIETILERISASHHSRLPVRKGGDEEIIGVLHVRKVINQMRQEALSPEELANVLSEPYFVPSGTPLFTQMQQFQENHQRIAFIVDEYGELKGLVTLEDILEEIVGEFTTQSPLKHITYKQEENGSWLVDGSTYLRELNRKLGLKLPLDGPKTLNGLILEHFEDIPEPATSFKIGQHTMEIVQTQDRIVKSVRIYA